jgi:hypothetical protein
MSLLVSRRRGKEVRGNEDEARGKVRPRLRGLVASVDPPRVVW